MSLAVAGDIVASLALLVAVLSTRLLAVRRGLGPDSIEPSVSVEVSKPDEVILHVRFPAPTRSRGRVEQDMVRRLLTDSEVN